MRRSIGDIPVRGTIHELQGYWRLVGNGEFGMHSHAGAWERETRNLVQSLE